MLDATLLKVSLSCCLLTFGGKNSWNKTKYGKYMLQNYLKTLD